MTRPSPRNGTARAAAARPRPAVTPVRPFALTVTAVQEVSPHLRRVTLGGTCLRDFATDDDGATWDLRVKLVVPPFGRPGIAASALEAVPGGSAASWYETWLGLPQEERGDLRTYTVREARLDTVYPEIDLDFVLHEDAEGRSGPAARWAQAARPGDPALIVGPNAAAAECAGIEFDPGLAGHVLLAGDETALPAIAGILRDLPAGMTAQAIIEVPDAADFQDLASHADVAVTWLARNEHDHGVLLSQAVRDRVPAPLCAPGPDVAGRAAASGRSLDVGPDRVLLWDTPQYRRLFGAVDEGAPGGDAGPGDEGAPGGHGDPGDEGARREGGAGREGAGEAPGATVRPFYAWIAGESGVVKELRRYLVRECGIDREQVAFMGYWKQGVAQA